MFASGWHHFAYTLKGNMVSMYHDGVMVEPTRKVTVAYTSNQSTFYIGSLLGASDFWEGKLDELRIYSRALTGEEIKQ